MTDSSKPENPSTTRGRFNEGIAADQWKQGVAGYKEADRYPDGFNAADFPSEGKEIRMTGNNMAFFFTAGVKDAQGQVVDIKADGTGFKRLIENIINSGSDGNRSSVKMQIDADVFENPERFVDKYSEMRSETGEAKRRELLGKEVDIIRDFVQGGGITRTIKEVLKKNARDGGGISDKVADILAERILAQNFRLQGVKTEDDPLKFATWEVKGWENGADTLLARQEYDKNTLMTERRWKLGRESVIHELAENGRPGAAAVLEAQRATTQLELVDLTYRAAGRDDTQSVRRNF